MTEPCKPYESKCDVCHGKGVVPGAAYAGPCEACGGSGLLPTSKGLELLAFLCRHLSAAEDGYNGRGHGHKLEVKR